MKKPIIKTTFLWIMTLILCVTTCATAFASAGDRTLKHYSASDSTGSVNNVYKTSGGFCADIEDMNGRMLLLFKDFQAEPEKYEVQENAEDDEQAEEVCCYFW